MTKESPCGCSTQVLLTKLASRPTAVGVDKSFVAAGEVEHAFD